MFCLRNRLPAWFRIAACAVKLRSGVSRSQINLFHSHCQNAFCRLVAAYISESLRLYAQSKVLSYLAFPKLLTIHDGHMKAKLNVSLRTCARTLTILGCLLSYQAAFSATGPYSPEDWPASKDPTKVVHYVVTDGGLESPGASWLADELMILNDGDQTTANYTIGGHLGKKVTNLYLNLADKSYDFWKDEDFIDILVQAYGDASLFNAQGQPRNFNFLTGTLPELNSPSGGQVPLEARNKKWNWVLFRIPNGVRASDGTRFVGSIPANAAGGIAYGGVNGGTIRIQSVPNLIVRVVAFGQLGAFGEPDDVNQFFPSDTCSPEPATNLAGLDFNHGITNHLQVLNNGEQTVTFGSNIGPASDKRKAVQPTGLYLNFGITSNYLGAPCNDPRAIKVGVEFYDDPAFAGLDVQFGPDAYATDDKGGVATYPVESLHRLAGTGQWIKRSWTVPAVNLKGINTGTLTGGPRFTSVNGQVWVSSFYLGVLRTGTNALAGQDPLPDWYHDPKICTDEYGNYAELDLAKDLKNGLDVGSSSGDQVMAVEEAGPASDRRQAVRPDNTAGFLNFAITDNAFGPSTQDNARLAICVTYYDDPALAGKRFKPDVYRTEVNGVVVNGATPDSDWVTIEGTDTWREAYWEIGDINFTGINQGPQAAARFSLEDKVFITSVRYGVIRPCGPNADKNPLADCKPIEDVALSFSRPDSKTLLLSWPTAATGFVLESAPDLLVPLWQTVNVTPTVTNNLNQVLLTPTSTTFYRLAKP
jgi:hypothetical protein